MYSFYQMPHLRDVQLYFGVLLSISAKEKINFSLWDASLSLFDVKTKLARVSKVNHYFNTSILSIKCSCLFNFICFKLNPNYICRSNN